MTEDKSRYKKGKLLGGRDETGKYPKQIRNNNALEFNNQVLRVFCKDTGIERENSPAYGHEQNGLTERANQIITTKGRSIMVENPHIPSKLWGEDDGPSWKESTFVEIVKLLRLGTLIFVPKTEVPTGYKLLSTKWVPWYKRNEHGKLVERKMRLVARGFEQKFGIDYNETFSSTVRPASWKILMAIAVHLGYLVDQADFPLLKEFMRTAGTKWATKLNWNEDSIILLSNPIYRLKQSGRQWQIRLKEELKRLGFDQMKTDTSVYANKANGSISATYVDDMISITPPEGKVEDLYCGLEKQLEIKRMGFPSHFLGVAIRRSKDSISISQGNYARDVLESHGMKNCRSVSTPMDPGAYADVVLGTEDPDPGVKAEYARLIGQIGYLVNQTRPDLAFSNGLWGRLLHKPTSTQLGHAKRMLQYLDKSYDRGIKYTKQDAEGNIKEFGNPFGLHGWVDSDYAKDPNDAHSTAGYVFMMCGGTISWASRKQKTIAKSSTEAEYYALSMATCEAIWIRNFMEEIGFPLDKPIVLYEDNNGANKLAHNPEFHARTKQINVEYHHTREAVEQGLIRIEYRQTTAMVADGLTKPLPRPGFESFIKMLNMTTVNLDD
ncbi:hypothetical protein AK830_g10805 [Neonectria ditissima]|uniref:Integrase catalytic domain-containing protein n=1 Tax=Neonectria ditissima TaxID=78410 RepID=A0A0P7B6H7_9HYPO|nr:hypothetical protein AK830_g10805 [Neonectria ditissima]